MNKTKRSSGSAGWLVCGTLAVALTGCTTYVEHRPAPAVYVPPPVAEPPALVMPPVVVTPVESPVVVIQTETDFYEPLSPHGEWVVVGTYGRCWRPTRVEVGWRPYAEGHWRRTEAGWYWTSDEPWGWATYHYGRWDWSAGFGWIWVPHTQWAPAWVCWRQGAGYVGWAPLPPSARVGARGIVEVHETAIAPRGFVFVSEQRLLEPVRPTTVVVNNTSVINQTVNITKIQVVNKTVINEGPRPEIIERQSGRKVKAVPVCELRRKDETEVVARRRNFPSTNPEKGQLPVRIEAAPVKSIPAREPRPAAGQAATSAEQPLPATRNEVRNRTEQKPAPDFARPAKAKTLHSEGRSATRNEKIRSEIALADAEVKGRPESKASALPRQTQPPSEATQQRQPPLMKNEVRRTDELKPTGTPTRPEAAGGVGNVRQRALERGKIKPETEQPTAVSKPTQPPAAQQVEKPAKSAREKPAARKRGDAKQKAAEKKKGEEPF